MEEERRKRKEMTKEKKEEENKREEKKNLCVGKKEKGERKEKGENRLCTLRFSVFRRSKVVSPRIKVGLLDERYE